jgi:hypothetical protein
MNNKKIARTSLWLVLGVLVLASLACKQAGEIITDAEATQRAMPTVTPTLAIREVADSEFKAGDEVVFAGKGYLVPFYANPGDERVLTHAARGDRGTVLNAVMYEGELWYEIQSVAGHGWAPADSIAAP